MNIWDEIYAKGEWGEGSGAGSTVETTKKYVEVVNDILRRKEGSILDLGCGIWGEWQTKLVLGWVNHYTGIDASKRAVTLNNIQVDITPTCVDFWCFDIIEYLSEYNEVKYDHVLIKDVLQHCSNDTVWKIIERLKYRRSLIITNDSVLDGVNRDCEDGGHRPIDLRLPPFNIKFQRAIDYPSSPHQKTILIMERP